ncbi:basic salivary proline-rich protein 1-like [Penaeus japonicus]|uniref:basic salivary proline-rich protein 1-like n=1 Tax=Penaeus japonicus TaxID=27405 RepID=UPI001C70C390|nr:basic salivary proline-rich protein 1-like [Penaeus japonicus]
MTTGRINQVAHSNNSTPVVNDPPPPPPLLPPAPQRGGSRRRKTGTVYRWRAWHPKPLARPPAPESSSSILPTVAEPKKGQRPRVGDSRGEAGRKSGGGGAAPKAWAQPDSYAHPGSNSALPAVADGSTDPRADRARGEGAGLEEQGGLRTEPARRGTTEARTPPTLRTAPPYLYPDGWLGPETTTTPQSPQRPRHRGGSKGEEARLDPKADAKAGAPRRHGNPKGRPAGAERATPSALGRPEAEPPPATPGHSRTGGPRGGRTPAKESTKEGGAPRGKATGAPPPPARRRPPPATARPRTEAEAAPEPQEVRAEPAAREEAKLKARQTQAAAGEEASPYIYPDGWLGPGTAPTPPKTKTRTRAGGSRPWPAHLATNERPHSAQGALSRDPRPGLAPEARATWNGECTGRQAQPPFPGSEAPATRARRARPPQEARAEAEAREEEEQTNPPR